jgi:hypothetical protein
MDNKVVTMAYIYPQRKSPAVDYSPEKCTVSQDGPVWFLADKIESGGEKREFVIPEGKAILFSVFSENAIMEFLP